MALTTPKHDDPKYDMTPVIHDMIIMMWYKTRNVSQIWHDAKHVYKCTMTEQNPVKLPMKPDAAFVLVPKLKYNDWQHEPDSTMTTYRSIINDLTQMNHPHASLCL